MSYRTNAEETVALMKEVGLRRLMGSGGCNCGWVQIRGYHIDRSCHRSDNSLRVYPQGDAFGGDSPEDLKLVTDEAERQMREEDDWSAFRVLHEEYRTTAGNRGIFVRFLTRKSIGATLASALGLGETP